MKVVERIIQTPQTSGEPNLDPIQFTYQPGIGVDDAVIYLLQWSLSDSKHCEDRVFWFFKCFQHNIASLLRGELLKGEVDSHLAVWIINSSPTDHSHTSTPARWRSYWWWRRLRQHRWTSRDWMCNTRMFILAINWTGLTTQASCTRRVKVICNCWGYLECAVTFCDTVLASAIFYHWQSSAGERESQRETGKDLTNWSRGPALSWTDP